MEKFHKIRFKVMTTRIIVFIVLSFALFFLDNLVLQKHAVYYLTQYSDILIAIWQIQATVSTLTLTATAYIIGRVNSTYYGVCIKDLLHLSASKKTLGLSFWESIVVTLILLFVNGCFVFLNNFPSVMFVFALALYLTIVITLECINVISESKKYANQAEELVSGLVSDIVNSSSKSKNQIETAREHFTLILEKFAQELENKVRSGIDLMHDQYYRYFYDIMRQLYKNHIVNLTDMVFQIQIDLLRSSIELKADKNIATLIIDIPNKRWTFSCKTDII